MRWAQVSASGEYTKPPIPQLAYGALINGRYIFYNPLYLFRVAFIISSASTSQQGLTIATRFAAVRTHHGNEQVLDYQIPRLMPLLAEAYVVTIVGKQIRKMYEKVLKDLEAGDISSVGEFHALTAGVKVISNPE